MGAASLLSLVCPETPLQAAAVNSDPAAAITALTQASAAGDLPAIRGLLDSGVSANAIDDEGETPLLQAVINDRLDAAALLVKAGAEVNDRPDLPSAWLPLARVKSVAMADLLHKAGADIHADMPRRHTNLLSYIVRWREPAIAAWFLRQGFDPNIASRNGENLLFGVKDADTVDLLFVGGVDPNETTERGRTPICEAANAEVARKLIGYGAKVTGFKPPLLCQLASAGGAGAIQPAIQAGTEHDLATLQSALVAAADLDHDETACALIKAGAQPNEPGVWSVQGDKMLPLEACAVSGNVKTAKVLLAAGADPSAGEPKGIIFKTALFNGKKEIAALLHQAGAKGVSDLAYAIAMQNEDEIKRLLAGAPAYTEDSAFWDEALSSAAKVGDLRSLNAALANGVPPRPSKEQDAYAHAAGEGQHEVLAVLLAARKPDAPAAELQQALWSAVWNSHPYHEANGIDQRPVADFERCVQMLLSAGAPANGGETADENAMVAAVFTRNPGGNAKVIGMLVKAGADPNPLLNDKANPNLHLREAVQESCAKGYCDKPQPEVIAQLLQNKR